MNYQSNSPTDPSVADCIISRTQVFSIVFIAHVTYDQCSIHHFPKARLVHWHCVKSPADWLEPVDTRRRCPGCQACQVGCVGFEDLLSGRLLMIGRFWEEFWWHWRREKKNVSILSENGLQLVTFTQNERFSNLLKSQGIIFLEFLTLWLS